MCPRVTSAVPGLIISGVRWDFEYTGHLKGEGLVQLSADRRVFIMPHDAAHPLSWIVFAVLVDDTFVAGSDEAKVAGILRSVIDNYYSTVPSGK